MDRETHPVIQGFFSGFADATGPTQSPITLTFEFNVVFEYTPVPALYQMVERKSALVNQMKVQKAENAVSRVDTGLDSDALAEMQAIATADPQTLRQIGYSLPHNERYNFLSFLQEGLLGLGVKAAMEYGPRIGAAIAGFRNKAPVKLARSLGTPQCSQQNKQKTEREIDLDELDFQFGNHAKTTSGNQRSKKPNA